MLRVGVFSGRKEVMNMKEKKRKGNFWVMGSGHRGTHGCTEAFLIEGEATFTPHTPDGGMLVKISGKILKTEFCNHCETDDITGKFVEWTGWYRPSYYGHKHIQL